MADAPRYSGGQETVDLLPGRNAGTTMLSHCAASLPVPRVVSMPACVARSARLGMLSNSWGVPVGDCNAFVAQTTAQLILDPCLSQVGWVLGVKRCIDGPGQHGHIHPGSNGLSAGGLILVYPAEC